MSFANPGGKLSSCLNKKTAVFASPLARFFFFFLWTQKAKFSQPTVLKPACALSRLPDKCFMDGILKAQLRPEANNIQMCALFYMPKCASVGDYRDGSL